MNLDFFGDLLQFMRIFGCCHCPASNNIEIIAKLLGRRQVVSAHPINVFRNNAFNSFGQGSDELVAMQLEHAKLDDASLLVLDQMQDAAVVLNLPLVLLERVRFGEEFVHVLFRLARDQRLVLLMN